MIARRIATLLFTSVLLSLSGEGITMEKIHATQPEAVIFLELAASEMERYRKTNGIFPVEWYLMDITFANGPYRMTDDGIRPKKEMKNIWKPKNCEYTYKIKSANKDGFTIGAINRDGVEEYEMRQGMDTPRKK